MIGQKGPPALRWRPTPVHIACDRRLRDRETELEQFTMDMWCAPELICTAHRADEIAQLGRTVLLSCGRFDICRRSTLSCWRRIRISATSFVLGLKNEAMIWRISRRNSIIKWQGYRVSASRLAESNFRYTQVSPAR